MIVCEGTKTEPAYFKRLQHEFRNRMVQVEITPVGGVPMTLVERARNLQDTARQNAKAQRDENLRFNKVWCVFDRDEHPSVHEACLLAERHEISVAFSNPCFELWALLHLGDQAERIHRHELQSKVNQLLGNKHPKLLPFDKFHHGYEAAVRRAEALRKVAQGTGQPRRNPSTNVDELTELIRQGGLR
ncbi:MAG: RloB domain-containing protein [Myxococcales bacterium]|nr:RloB domain-containing protein [Myxococcales bacterium]